MARWEPDSRGRLQAAALALFGERGYESTTVAEIAERAGLTERTFFRYFADKREVLFRGSEQLQELMVRAVVDAPGDASPLDALTAGLEAAGAAFRGGREGARQRQAVIMASPELRERELIKLATLAQALADALRQRGIPESTATLTAEAGMAVFRVAFGRWVEQAEQREFGELVRASMDELRAATSE